VVNEGWREKIVTTSHKLTIGNYGCWTLADGQLTYPGSLLLPPEGRPPEQVDVPYTAMLVDTGSARILIDTGAGALGPDTGKLPENMASAGFSAADIDMVVISHGHPDHIAGVARYPNARVVMMRREFEFWTAVETQTKLEAGEIYGIGSLEKMMAAYVREHLAPLRDPWLLDQATEIEPGVLVLPAPGHTPGHVALLISSGRQQLLYAADAVIHPAQFENPGWTCAFDLSRDQTVETRKQLLDRAASDRCFFVGFHLPGGIGAVEVRQSRFRWEPLSANATSG
jgi:glyoxylase-like metal-dependent hydrolase (beta-lactamase superfamily II)